MIPNILWQTWKSKDLPKSVKSQADSWTRSNPELQINLMDDKECAKFILENFGETVHFLYMALPQPIMRADFWRIAVVYINGGYYADLDIVCNSNITNFISGTVDAVFMRELNNISNYFFGATPKHPVLKATLDRMIDEMSRIIDKETQSFGMHSLHQSVRDYYNVIETNYITTDSVQFLLDSEVRSNGSLVHNMASLSNNPDYGSWRANVAVMNQDREKASDIMFFTTFNKNGYDLYGKMWVESFSALANYYNKFRAKIFYEGFTPDITHPNIEWVSYEEALPQHKYWKRDFLKNSQHSDYVRTMAVRFSHKAFVIQYVLETDIDSHDYLIWLDGDCVFKAADYTGFPDTLLGDKFLACQIEHNHDLNHVESGILIFNGKHQDTKLFNKEFTRWYQVDNLLTMGQPYDGFLVSKALITSACEYVNLNAEVGGGIQSDPSMTFLHPEIKSKFIHNIGWTGKNQYAGWETVFNRDEIYQKMRGMLFNFGTDAEMNRKKEHAVNKLNSLRTLRGRR